MKKICARCGASDESKEFIGAFCTDCFGGGEAPFSVPRTIEYSECTSCGSLWTGKDSRHPLEGENPVESLIASKVRSPYPFEAHVKIVGSKASVAVSVLVQGKGIRRSALAKLAVRRVLCDDCSKKARGYHELIIQLRGENKNRIRNAEAVIVQEIASMDGTVTKNEEKEHGTDLFVAERDAGMKAVMRLHQPYKATRKLLGVKHGRHRFLTTILFRL